MVSVVIPTYKRKNSLTRLIQSINQQSFIPNEIIIVASGYDENDLLTFQNLNTRIKIISSTPSVCKQRNIGITNAKSKYILLCDDDIELPNNYIASLIDYFNKNYDVKIVTGSELQKNKKEEWKEVRYKTNYFSLLYSYIFGLGICSDITNLENSKNFIILYIYKKLTKNKNGITKGGWPLLTHFSFPVMKTSIYGLGCAMIKRTNLLENPYSENLGQNGIGDNYKVALKINGPFDKIHVLRNVCYKHYKEISNRHLSHINYFKRCLSLHKFLIELPHFSFYNRLFFIWSLLGGGLRFLIKGEMNYFRYNQKVIRISFFNLFKH